MVSKSDLESPKALRGPERSSMDHLLLNIGKGKSLPSVEALSSQGKYIYFSGGENSFLLPPKRVPISVSNNFNLLRDYNDKFDMQPNNSDKFKIYNISEEWK